MFVKIFAKSYVSSHFTKKKWHILTFATKNEHISLSPLSPKFSTFSNQCSDRARFNQVVQPCLPDWNSWSHWGLDTGQWAWPDQRKTMTKTKTFREQPHKTILERHSLHFWQWQQQSKYSLIVTLQWRVTRDSICNSCSVFNTSLILLKTLVRVRVTRIQF